MSAYRLDFLNDYEFELLVNDLLSSLYNVRIEGFKPGPDKGIDGRFYTKDNGTCIIQSKHWEKSGCKALVAELRKTELAKIQKLNPQKYFLATSVPLSPANKQEIKNLFYPWIQREDDIFGQEDINSLISRLPHVLKRHDKLWFAGADTLRLITSAAIIGRSAYTIEEIEREIPKYVFTKSHREAIAKLEDKKSIVITGEPGVGKTTLAKQLILHYLGMGFELIQIDDSLSEAEACFDKDKKQFFYYDDFLGQNYLSALTGNKDSRILGFISRVGHSKDKRFVLTSRTTILNRAIILSDHLRNDGIDRKSYEIKVNTLTALEKAKLLYNHLFYSELGNDYRKAVFKNKECYREIINHRGFNPRIIQFISEAFRVEGDGIESENYWNYIRSKLDNPQDVWRGVYDYQLDDNSRWLMRAVVVNGGVIDEKRLRAAFLESPSLCEDKSRANRLANFTQGTRLAFGSVLTKEIYNPTEAKIKLFNPSVGDFIIKELSQDPQSIAQSVVELSTLESYQNLYDLRKATTISDESYWSILGILKSSLEKLDRPDLKIRLAMLIERSLKVPTLLKSWSAEIIRGLFSLYAAAGPKEDIASDVIALLWSGEFSSIIWEFMDIEDSEEFGDFSNKLNDLLESLLELNLSSSDLQSIGSFAVENKYVISEDFIDSFKSCVIKHLQEDLHENLQESGIFDDLLNDIFSMEAYDAAVNWVSRYLEEYHVDFNQKDAEGLVDTVDIPQIMNDIIDSQSDGNYGLESPSRDNKNTEDAIIDELFLGSCKV